MLIREAIQEFASFTRAQGSKPRTQQWYEKTLTMLFRDHLDDSTKVINVFLVNRLLTREVRPATLANYDSCLRGFCKWLSDMDVLEKNPFEKRKRVTFKHEMKQTLTQKEIERLFKAARETPQYRHRTVAMLSLLLGTGIRAGELVTLKLTDIDWEQGTMRVRGKTGVHSVPLSKKVYRALRYYITHERRGSNPHVFVYENRPISPKALSNLLRRLAKRAGVEKPVASHLFRHTFATEYLKNGGDGFSLQRILRHTTPTMTQRYVHFVGQDLQEKLEVYSPLNKIG